MEIGVGRRKDDNGCKLYQVVLYGNRGYKPLNDVVHAAITDNPLKIIEKLKQK